MNGILDIKSPNFLGGVNVHNVITIALLIAVAVKVYKK